MYMNKLIGKPVWAIAILVVLSAYLFFFRLGGMALTDPDETFYAQTAKEMLDRSEWHTPYLYGKPQFEKPILIYWMMEASYKLLGVNETAARLPSAVFGLAGVIAIYLLGSMLFGRKAGFLSALVLATNVEYIILTRACITDMMLAVSMLFGVLFFFYGYAKGNKYFYILSSAAFAVAVLAKGPIALILPLAAFIVFLFFSKDIGILKRIPFGWCALVFLAVAAPWYVIAYRMHGKEFIDAFFGFHNVTRFMQSEHKIGSQVYYNIPVIMAGFFPWSVFLPVAFWHIFKKARQAAEGGSQILAKKGYIFILTWFFAIFLFFTASSTKLPTYIFPCFISLALMTGVLLKDFLDMKQMSRFFDNAVKVSYYILVAAIISGAIGISIYLKYRKAMPEVVPGVIISSCVLVAGFIITTVFFIRRKYPAAIYMIVGSLAVFLLPLNLTVLPQIERYEASKEVSAKLLSVMSPGDKLGCQSNYLPGLAFYAGKFAENLDAHYALLNFLNSKERVWCVIKDKNHKALYDPEVNKEYVKPSYVIYKFGKRSIVTNEEPAGGYLFKREAGNYEI
jgi:4-amino-4-deoxy-L-arabinose transferase-like glycosyltransferase